MPNNHSENHPEIKNKSQPKHDLFHINPELIPETMRKDTDTHSDKNSEKGNLQTTNNSGLFSELIHAFSDVFTDKKTRKMMITLVIVLVLITGIGSYFIIGKIHSNHEVQRNVALENTQEYRSANHGVINIHNVSDLKLLKTKYNMKFLHKYQINRLVSPEIPEKLQLTKYRDVTSTPIGGGDTTLYVYQYPNSDAIALFAVNNSGDIAYKNTGKKSEFDASWYALQSKLVKGMAQYDNGKHNADEVNDLARQYKNYDK